MGIAFRVGGGATGEDASTIAEGEGSSDGGGDETASGADVQDLRVPTEHNGQNLRLAQQLAELPRPGSADPTPGSLRHEP